MKIKNLIFGTFLFLASALPVQASQVYFEQDWQPQSTSDINLIDITFNEVTSNSISTQLVLFFDMNENQLYEASTDYGTYAYCVDFSTALYYDKSYNYNLGYSINNLDYAAWLFDTYWVDPSISQETTYTEDELEHMAALQLAIWEVIYDYDSSGPDIFSYDADSTTVNVNSLYNTYIAALSTASLSDLDATYAVMELKEAGGTVGQTVLVRNPVPEPGTFMLFGAGIVCISAIARRKRL